MIKIINVYKDSRVMELTSSSNLGLGVHTDNNVDLLRFTFDNMIVGTATLLTDLTDTNGDLVAFPLTINQEENSYDIEITNALVSQPTITIQLEIALEDDTLWHSKQHVLQVDNCLEMEEGEIPTNISSWLANANLQLNQITSAENQRVINENARVTNEELRVGAETDREAYITDLQRRVNNGEFNGQDGADAKINGVNTLTIQEGQNINITQSGSVMTISSTGGGGGTSEYVDLINKEQTISAVKTFTALPESSIVPTTNNQLVNKKYVDDSITSAITDALGGNY